MVRAWLSVGLAVAPAAALTLSRVGETDAAAEVPKEHASPMFRQELINYKDLQYYGNVTVGDQTVNCVLDTGSVEFVVLSDKCKNQCGSEEKLFHTRMSATYTRGFDSQILSYGSGTLTVSEAMERVTLGPMHVATSFWEVIDANMPLLLESDFQAIIGMGPINPDRETEEGTRSLILPRVLHVERFGICMGRGTGSSGWITWNDDSISERGPSMTRLQVPRTGYWMVQIRDVHIGQHLIGCKEGCGAVIDSGTSLLAMPEDASARLENMVASLKADCHDLAEIPDIRFRLGPGAGIPYALPSDSYVGEVVGEAPAHMAKHFSRRAKKSHCEVAVMNVDMSTEELGAVWILGVPFLRHYYSVFSQATETSPSAVYTAVADTDCRPSDGIEQSLISTRPRQPRRIDASALRMPMWARAQAPSATDSTNKALEQNVIMGRKFVEPDGSAPPRLHH